MSASNYQEKAPPGPLVTDKHSEGSIEDVGSGAVADVTAGSQALHRKLRGKEVQLFAIGGAIGTCKCVQRTSRGHHELSLCGTLRDQVANCFGKRSTCRWVLHCPREARQVS